LVDGVLSDADKTRLEEILRKNPAARDYYRTYLATHLELAEAASQMNLTAANRRSWILRARAPLAIAALVPLAFGIALWGPWRDSNREPAGNALATIQVAEDARWSLSDPPAAGLDLHAGRVELTAGKVALALGGNQTLTLAAPTDFELMDDDELFLHRGSASLRIDDGGSTYTIRVPRGKVVDLGTEFSVKVATDGTTDVWVFEGKAEVTLTSGPSSREQQALTAGQSLRMGETLAPSPAGAADFIRPLSKAAENAGSPPAVIADFSAEFPTSTLGSGQPFGGTEKPATGWNYLWNPSGTLGTAANYQALVANTVNTFPAADGGGIFPMFTKFGNLAFNAGGQSNFQFGRIAKTSVHPGRYVVGKDYRAIIAYTIQPDEAGEIRIDNSSLVKHRIDGFVTNGVDLDVFVNDTPMVALKIDGFESLTAASFNGKLGRLSAGDTIYVALGNNGDDGQGHHETYDAFDACVIDFQLVRMR
jgi:ferric-dicitrate binding protein FerR (iron transport regulator)